jgi:hypothetical protein
MNGKELALSLAQQAEEKTGFADADAVIRRARKYYDFLTGKRDSEIIEAAQALASKLTSPAS